MSPTKYNLIQREVSKTVREINKAWLHRDFAKLDEYLSHDTGWDIFSFLFDERENGRRFGGP